MPMRALRATQGYASAHIMDNLWLWIGICAAGTALAGMMLSYAADRGSRWGDVMAIFGALLGILVMIKSQEGYVSPYTLPDEDDDQVVTPTSTTPASTTAASNTPTSTTI